MGGCTLHVVGCLLVYANGVCLAGPVDGAAGLGGISFVESLAQTFVLCTPSRADFVHIHRQNEMGIEALAARLVCPLGCFPDSVGNMDQI